MNRPGTADREIVITRLLDAPRELVFDAWTDCAHIEKWWGPNGFKTSTEERTLRSGGVWRYVMHGPDGTDYKNFVAYHEVIRPERLVYSHGEVEGQPAHFEVTVTFEDVGGKTRLTMQSVFPTAEARDFVVREFGAIEGGKQTLDRFQAHLGHQRFGVEPVVITRVFDAPRGMVFKAWTDPVQVSKWWGPNQFTNPRCEWDARPGGAIRVDMRAPDGTVNPMGGAFREVDPPYRIVFTSSLLDEKGVPMFEILNVVTLDEEGKGTKLTLRSSVVTVASETGQDFSGMAEGWSQSLDRLNALVTAA